MLKKFLVAAAMIIAATTSSMANEYGTPDEAKAMAEKAAPHIQTAGLDQAIKDFMTPGGDWHDRDLYVFVFAPDGVTLAHGAKASLVGRNLMKLRDVDGKFLTKMIVEVADKGWVDYKWQNPKTNAVEPKTSYVIKVGDKSVGVGAYKR